MKLFLIIICCILIVLIINNIFIMLYCILQEIKDKKLDEKKQTSNLNDNSHSDELEQVSTGRRIYRWLNAYLYGWMRFNIIKVGNIPSYRIRKFFYKHIFRMKIQKKTVIFSGCEFRSPWKIHLGKCTVAANCILDGRNGIYIEDNAVLGACVHIWTEEHDLNDPYFRVMPQNKQPVIIGKRVWVCSDSTLLPGTVVNEGAVVASRACVTKECEAYGIYAGIPAKKIGERNKNLKYELSGIPTYHFY